MLPPFLLARPNTLQEAFDLLDDDDVIPYCGGTELLLAMRAGLLHPDVLVDLKSVPELGGVRLEGPRLLIGATTKHAELIRHPLVREHAPFLGDVERRVGNPRVRAQGSIGGNLGFGEPRSDLLTALIALGASVNLRGKHTDRTVSAAEFLEGQYATVLERAELLESVSIPLPVRPIAVYAKYQVFERPTVAVAAVGDVASIRVVIGAAGEVPVYGDFPSGEVDVASLIAAVDPIDDLSGSARYKRSMAEVYVGRALAKYVEQMG